MRNLLIPSLLLLSLSTYGLCINSRFLSPLSGYEDLIIRGGIFDQTFKPFKQIDTQYSFRNPLLALKVLESLNPINTTEPDYPTDGSGLKMKRDPTYCTRAQEEFVKNPTPLFKTVSFITDYNPHSYLRETIIPMIGYDAMPFLNNPELARIFRKEPPHELDLQASTIFTKMNVDHIYQIGTHMGCIHQNYNHINGASHLADKDAVAHTLKEYANKLSHQPTCSLDNKFFPQTWLLAHEKECVEWFDMINSPEYETEKAEKTIVFIRKIGAKVHRGKGVVPVDNEEEAALREMYANGEKCGVIPNNYIIQRYIHNPLLVQGHKFDFRVYMMISSTNPLVVYYHDGFLRVSLFEYDVNSKEKGVHLTNTAQSEKVFEDEDIQKRMGMTETELRNFQMWNYQRLAEYLVSEGKIESVEWIDDYLRPKIEHAMQHLVRAVKNHLTNATNVWELYGVDFMLDDELNLWFIECNIGPVIKASNEEKGKFLQQLLTDAFEIVTAQLRSRMKRVIRFVNELTAKEVKMNTFSEITIPNFSEKKKAFDDLLRNRVEDEFKIKPDNSWIKIVDETLEGTARYNGMFPTECVY